MIRGMRGMRLTTSRVDTFAEGVATRTTYDLTFPALQAGLAGFVTVTDSEIAESLRTLVSITHNLVEGAAAMGFAALPKLRKQLAGRRVGHHLLRRQHRYGDAAADFGEGDVGGSRVILRSPSRVILRAERSERPKDRFLAKAVRTASRGQRSFVASLAQDDSRCCVLSLTAHSATGATRRRRRSAASCRSTFA